MGVSEAKGIFLLFSFSFKCRLLDRVAFMCVCIYVGMYIGLTLILTFTNQCCN